MAQQREEFGIHWLDLTQWFNISGVSESFSADVWMECSKYQLYTLYTTTMQIVQFVLIMFDREKWDANCKESGVNSSHPGKMSLILKDKHRCGALRSQKKRVMADNTKRVHQKIHTTKIMANWSQCLVRHVSERSSKQEMFKYLYIYNIYYRLKETLIFVWPKTKPCSILR